MSHKRVLSTMLLSWSCFCLMSIQWPLFTYSLSFGPGTSLLGGLGFGLFDSADRLRANATIPEHAFCAFQMAFAIVTAAVVSGSVAGRVTLGAWSLFCFLWHLLAYVPLARWVFYPGGWLAQMGVLDFAGGLVVETNSGVSGLVLAALVGWQERRLLEKKRDGGSGGEHEEGLLLSLHHHHPTPGSGAPAHQHGAAHAPPPHSVPLILLGSGLLHFGWLGFNAGSAITSGYEASRAFLNTHLAGASGILGWAAAEVLFSGLPAAPSQQHSPLSLAFYRGLGKGRPTAVGAATGVVVGLCAITPACGFISPMASLGLGFVAAFISYGMERIVHRVFGVWDTLNAFSGHGVAGMVGTLAVGLFASVGEGAPANGAVFGGAAPCGSGIAACGWGLLGVQALGVGVAVCVAAAGTLVSWGCVCGVFAGMGWGSPLLAVSDAGAEEAWSLDAPAINSD